MQSKKGNKMIKCFLDLDGVLVDFMKGAHEHHGLPYSYDDYPYNLNEWDCLPPEKSGMTAREFWDGLTSDVWANLEWHDDGREILSVVERFFPPENICILTSPTSNGASAKGKIQWIQKNMPKYRRKYLIGPCKHFCAGKNSILIDDGNHNIDAFRGAGGLTVLVPRKWNSDHALDGHAASCVAEQLGMLERTFDERFSQ